MQGSFNTHLIALSCLAFVVAAAFLIFDLDDKLYPKHTDGYVASVNYSEAPSHTLVAEPEPIQEKQQAPNIIESKPVQKQMMRTQIEPKSRLSELENKVFTLGLNGDAHLGVSSITKKASLTLKLAPIKGTALKEFQVSDARLLLDDSAISIIGTGAKIDGTQMTLEFLSENVGKFTILGSLDNSILDDTNNKENVRIDDQNFYLVKKDVPYRLQMSGILTN